MRVLTLTSDQSGVDTTRLRSGGDVPVGDGNFGLLPASSRSLRCSLVLLLLLDLLRVAVEEHVDHDVPSIGSTGDRAAKAEDLAGKEPPGKTDRVTGLVVDGNSDVDELEGRVGVAEGDDGDVDVGRLTDSLVVDAGVGHDDETRLLERAGDVVREATRGETTSDGLGTSVGSVLEDGTVAVWAGGDDTDVIGVFNGGDDTSSKNELLPGLANVDDVDA